MTGDDWAALATVICGLLAGRFRLFRVSAAHFRSATDRAGVAIHSPRQAQHRAGVEMPLAQRAPCCADPAVHCVRRAQCRADASVRFVLQSQCRVDEEARRALPSLLLSNPPCASTKSRTCQPSPGCPLAIKSLRAPEP